VHSGFADDVPAAGVARQDGTVNAVELSRKPAQQRTTASRSVMWRHAIPYALSLPRVAFDGVAIRFWARMGAATSGREPDPPEIRAYLALSPAHARTETLQLTARAEPVPVLPRRLTAESCGYCAGRY
jgi:hypothetical protein